jgi:hypothetical protein
MIQFFILFMFDCKSNAFVSNRGHRANKFNFLSMQTNDKGKYFGSITIGAGVVVYDSYQ